MQACCTYLTYFCCWCRFRHIVDLYAKGLENLAENLAQHELWLSLYGDTDRLTAGWLSHGASLLKECTERAAALAQDVSAASSQAPGDSPLPSCLTVCGRTLCYFWLPAELQALPVSTSWSHPKGWQSLRCPALAAAGPQAERADLRQHLEQQQPPQMSYRLSISEDEGIKKRSGPQGPQGPSGPAGQPRVLTTDCALQLQAGSAALADARRPPWLLQRVAGQAWSSSHASHGLASLLLFCCRVPGSVCPPGVLMLQAGFVAALLEVSCQHVPS